MGATGVTMGVHYFNSIGEFRDVFTPGMEGEREISDFNGNQTLEQAKANLMKGRLSAVKKSDKLLEQFSADTIETARPVWRHSMAGYFPCVPSYLSDSPESMRTREETRDNASPVRVFASVCVSAGLTPDELQRRGVAILALCRKLQEIRPVELWIFAELDGYVTDDNGNCCIPTIKLETAPLDLASATYAMTDPGFLRQLCFTFGNSRGFTGNWAWDADPRGARAAEKRRIAFQATQDDLIIPGGFASDPLINNPVAWVNEQLRRFLNTED